MIEDDSDVIWRLRRHHVTSVSQCQTIIRSTHERKEHVADKNWVPHSSVKKGFWTNWLSPKGKTFCFGHPRWEQIPNIGKSISQERNGFGIHKRLYLLGPTQDFKFCYVDPALVPTPHPLYLSLLPFAIYSANINGNLCVNVLRILSHSSMFGGPSFIFHFTIVFLILGYHI